MTMFHLNEVSSVQAGIDRGSRHATLDLTYCSNFIRFLIAINCIYIPASMKVICIKEIGKTFFDIFSPSLYTDI